MANDKERPENILQEVEEIEQTTQAIYDFLGVAQGGDSIRKILGDLTGTLAQVEQMVFDANTKLDTILKILAPPVPGPPAKFVFLKVEVQ